LQSRHPVSVSRNVAYSHRLFGVFLLSIFHHRIRFSRASWCWTV